MPTPALGGSSKRPLSASPLLARPAPRTAANTIAAPTTTHRLATAESREIRGERRKGAERDDGERDCERGHAVHLGFEGQRDGGPNQDSRNPTASPPANHRRALARTAAIRHQRPLASERTSTPATTLPVLSSASFGERSGSETNAAATAAADPARSAARMGASPVVRMLAGYQVRSLATRRVHRRRDWPDYTGLQWKEGRAPRPWPRLCVRGVARVTRRN